ncbi:MAG: hypothetical protein Q9170_002879, partial [Blastenia crenularia]
MPDIYDTFRLLLESMDFANEDGNAWEVLREFCNFTVCYKSGVGIDEQVKTRVALLLWMLMLSSSEIKMNATERHYADILGWTVGENDDLAEVSRLVLRLGGPEPINTPASEDGGYTILHYEAEWGGSHEYMGIALEQGLDIHRLGLDRTASPEEESPFSLVLYSSWLFADWLDFLHTSGKDFEEFVTQEIQRNHTIHLGWEKKTLLNLSTYDHSNNYEPQGSGYCSDCNKRIDNIKVQPHWRHFLERIKQGIVPYDSSAEASSEVDDEGSEEDWSTAGAVNNTNDPTDLDDISSEVEPDPELPSDLES